MCIRDSVRSHRNNVLSNSDGQVAEDMPDALKEQWKTYRQQLRDLPSKMTAAGVHPNFADMMFPEEPNFVNPPSQPNADATEAESWMPPSAQ